MTLFGLATLGAFGLIVGVFIGCLGIGGVMLVPALSYLGGIPIPTAIAAAMMGYLLTGAVGAAIYARRKSIRWSMALWLCAGAMPAALAGAWTSNNVPPVFLELCIGLLTTSAGVHAIMGMRNPSDQRRALSRPVLVLIGVVTGFVSAITGTGGPLVVVPVLLWLQMPILTAIGLSQAVQFPIATLATVGNFVYGAPDLLLGAILAVALAGGAGIGANLAHAIPRDLLRRIVAAVLIGVGLVILVKIFSALIGLQL